MEAVEKELEKFQQLGCQVVVVENRSKRDGLIWRKDKPYKLPVIVDPEWLLYRRLGLRRYIFLSAEGMLEYAEGLVAGAPLPDLTGVYNDDDFFMMAGNLITQSDGKLVYVLKQRHFNQRPSVEELLLFLEQQGK